MYSFKDIDLEVIYFEDIKELYLSKSTDIVTDEVSAYFVEYNDKTYRVDEVTYEAIENRK